MIMFIIYNLWTSEKVFFNLFLTSGGTGFRSSWSAAKLWTRGRLRSGSSTRTCLETSSRSDKLKSGSTSLVLLRTSSDSGRKCEEWVGNQSAAQWERLLQGEEGNTRLYLYTSTYLPSTLNILPGYDQEPWDVLQLARDGVGFDLQVQIQVVILFSLQKSFFPCFIPS